jgi:hypothetical protein
MLFLRLYLWFAPHLLLGLCLIGVSRRKLQSQCPIFFGYVVAEITIFLVFVPLNLLSVYSLLSLVAYQWATVIGTVILSVFELGVLYELSNELVLSRLSLAAAFRALLRWTAGVLLLIAAVVSAWFSQPGVRRVMAVFQTLDFSSSLIKIGLLLVLLLFTRALHISWRRLPTGIALGFAISASIEMAAAAFLSAGHSAYVRIDILRMAAFHISVLVWLIYIFLPERLPRFTGTGLHKSDLELWDQELRRMVR